MKSPEELDLTWLSDVFKVWSYDPERLVLVYRGKGKSGRGYAYEIDLERCTTSASLLDWIIQLSHKMWLPDADLGKLVRALDLLLSPQRTLCGRALIRPNMGFSIDSPGQLMTVITRNLRDGECTIPT